MGKRINELKSTPKQNKIQNNQAVLRAGFMGTQRWKRFPGLSVNVKNRQKKKKH